jgi:16S rRNA (uracil1498-N3)-methyltransferase
MALNLRRDMTGSIRLFTTESLHDGASFAATPEQAHYLGSVMRQCVGDCVQLFNGVDGEWRARIAALRKDRATLSVELRTREQAFEPELTLLFAPLKRDTTHLVIEKATELGVTRIVPVLTERTNTARLNLDRLTAIAREAAEQCERLTVPAIEEPRRLLDTLSSWPVDRVVFAALERIDAATPSYRPERAALLVGPEGGFTPAELDVFRRLSFVEAIGLGPRVLRAETAVIAGLALLQAAPTR